MKFRFVGDGDCPPWVLAALHATGTLPAALFTRLLTLLAQEGNEDAIKECLRDTNLGSRAEAARAAAALRWSVRQARANSCPAGAFLRELLVLGVPRTHALALADTLDAQRAEPLETGFSVNNLTGVEAEPGPEGSIMAVKLTLYSENTASGRKGKKEVLLDKALARNMLKELKLAQAKLEDCETQCELNRRGM